MSLILPNGFERRGPLPRIEIAPEAYGTYGPEAVELGASAGLIADDWQEDALSLLLSYRKDGQWSCWEYAEWVSRQNGKGAIGEIRVLFGLYVLREQLLMWSAHESKTALEAMRRIEAIVTNYDDFRKKVKRIMHSKGEEGIELITGERLRFFARTAGAGRGFSGDYNHIDEAYAYTFDQQAAAMPTLSARPNPQTCYTSTPPLDGDTGGDVMFQLRDRVEPRGDDGVRRLAAEIIDLGYRDWGVGDVDIEREAKLARLSPSQALADDEQVWEDTNPALGIRITKETVRRERRAMGLWEFYRERLMAWPPRAGDAELPAIDMRDFRAIIDPESRRAPGAQVALFLDVTPLGDHGVISLWTTREDGLGLGRIIDYEAGIGWMAERAAERRAEFDAIGVGIDGGGTADKLLRDDLAAAGITEPEDRDPDTNEPLPRRGDLCVHTTGDVIAGVAQMLTAIKDHTWRTVGEPQLELAAENSGLRTVGDGFAWARRVRVNRDGKRLPTIDISPLVSITGARRTYVMWIDKVVDAYDPMSNIW